MTRLCDNSSGICSPQGLALWLHFGGSQEGVFLFIRWLWMTPGKKSLCNNFHPAKQFWAGMSTDAACQNEFACHSSTITSTYSVSPHGNNHELTCCSVSNEFLWNVPDCLISQCGGHWRIPLSVALCCQRRCATLCQGRDLITIYQSHWVHIRLIWWESSQTQPYIFDQCLGLLSSASLCKNIDTNLRLISQMDRTRQPWKMASILWATRWDSFWLQNSELKN